MKQKYIQVKMKAKLNVTLREQWKETQSERKHSKT